MRQEVQSRPRRSTIERREVDGRDVFLKDYRQNDWRDTPGVLNQRTARETEVVCRLATLVGMERRLGRQIVIQSDPEAARIVTEAAPGEALEKLLVDGSWRDQTNSCVRALLVAGRWLREFQTLSTDYQTEVDDSINPTDLVDYCRLRLEALARRQCAWATSDRASQVLSWIERRMGQSDEADRLLCWSHGDFGPSNMVWDGFRLTPIDFATARLDLPLVDVTYLIHRLEMLAIQFPWRRWPLRLWRSAIARGYLGAGSFNPDCLADQPLYDALTVRHGLCRLLTLARARSPRAHQRIHDRYVRRRVRRRIEQIISRP